MKWLFFIGCYLAVACKQDSTKWPAKFGFGKQATAAAIAKLDLDVGPDGKGLPPGEGKPVVGKLIYTSKCVACHSESDTLQTAGPPLIGNTKKTIGNYWPYATTLFDYIRRAMPYNQPGSLTNDEVYHLTAYLLQANKIIKENTIINAQSLPAVKMPAQDRFVPDDRHGGTEIR